MNLDAKAPKKQKIQVDAPGKKKKICAFLWSYYGYPASCYEGVNVEVMRYRNGQIMAKTDKASRQSI